MIHPWTLAELNYGQVKAQPPFEVAVLPLGATEPHNLHLPYGTDTFQVEVIAARACGSGHRGRGAGRGAAGDPVRDRDQPDAVSPGDEPQPDDRSPGSSPTSSSRWPRTASASASCSTGTAATT